MSDVDDKISDPFAENECTGNQNCRHTCSNPNPTIVNAVRLAYYTGDFKGAIDVIAEAVGENVLVSGQLPKEGSDAK